MTKSEDAVLFERWLTVKDGDAFAELARRHAPVVFDLAARALGDRSAAEDVVQEALLDLALEPTRKPTEVGVVAWLARFAICRARNQRSSERSRARRQQVVGLRRPEEVMPDERLEQQDELDRALSTAEPEERTVLAMRYLHGWDYDRIAQALDTTEGAARVRVHRALTSVRTRLAADEAAGMRPDVAEQRITRSLAAMPLIPLSSGSLDAAIRAALDAAGAPAPAVPSSRLPSTVRAGLQTFGALIVMAGAASTASLPTAPDAAYAGSAAETASVLPPGGTALAAGPSADGRTSPASLLTLGVPRPQNWDQGALARLARGETEPRSEPVSESPKSAANAQEAPAPQAAPAAIAVPVAGEIPLPPSALRPSTRGASAANCDPGSSDGERADALGGFARSAVVLEPVERPAPETRDLADDDSAAAAPSGDGQEGRQGPRRTTSRGRQASRPFAKLDDAQQALVEQAAEIVRNAVAAGVTVDPETRDHARKDGVREIRKQLREARRRDREDAPSHAPKPRASAKKLARMNRVVSMLVDVALADGRSAGDLRWPDGVDLQAALEEVIRLLSVPSADRRPDIADEATGDPAVTDRRPDLE